MMRWQVLTHPVEPSESFTIPTWFHMQGPQTETVAVVAGASLSPFFTFLGLEGH